MSRQLVSRHINTQTSRANNSHDEIEASVPQSSLNQGFEYFSKQDKKYIDHYDTVLDISTERKDIHVRNTDSKRYFDFLAGHFTINKGYCFPCLIRVIRRQCQMLILCFCAFHNNVLSKYGKIIVKRNTKKWLVFILTFLSYAFYHASRKNLSGIKGSLINEWTSNATHNPLFYKKSDASNFLGVLDSLFMMFYAVSLVFWGYIGDRWNPLYAVVIGMFGSGFALTMFGILPFYTHFYSIVYYLFFYAIFGIFQAAGWPNEVTIMANWFTKNNRGLIMGLWAACQPVGNIIGAIIVSLVQPFGYEYTFIVNSILIVGVGLVMWKAIESKPPRLKSSNLPDSPEKFNQINEAKEDNESFHQPISMLNALHLPNVLPYCLCNACLKFVNYAFFFWLPFYLHSNFGWNESKANQLSAWYDFGGIVGSIIGGIISDRIGRRSPVIVTMLIASLGLLIAYADAGPNKIVNIALMTLLGFTISGPYNLIVGTISVDLGSQEALAGNPKAMSTVTGLVDASGSAGSAIGQLFVPLVQNNFGWVFVFYLFILMNFLSALCLFRRFIHDMKDLLWKNRGSDSTRVSRQDYVRINNQD